MGLKTNGFETPTTMMAGTNADQTSSSTQHTHFDLFDIGKGVIMAVATVGIFALGTAFAPMSATADVIDDYIVGDDGQIMLVAGTVDLDRTAFTTSFPAKIGGDGTVFQQVETIHVATQTETTLGVHAVHDQDLNKLAAVLDIDVRGQDLLQLTPLGVIEAETITAEDVTITVTWTMPADAVILADIGWAPPGGAPADLNASAWTGHTSV